MTQVYAIKVSVSLPPQSTVMLDNAQIRHTSGPSITSHSQLHTDLLSYSGLTRWLKECEPIRFSEVMEVTLALHILL